MMVEPYKKRKTMNEELEQLKKAKSIVLVLRKCYAWFVSWYYSPPSLRVRSRLIPLALDLFFAYDRDGARRRLGVVKLPVHLSVQMKSWPHLL